jgi:hypothetical protein
MDNFNDNISAEKFCNTLISLNMRETAEVFKREYQSIFD